MTTLTLIASRLAQHGDEDDGHVEETSFWADAWNWISGDGLPWLALGFVIVAIVAVIAVGVKMATRSRRPGSSPGSDTPQES